MRILITGVNGFVGSNLSRYLIEMGHTVTGIVRNRAKARGLDERMRVVVGKTTAPGDWQAAIEDQDALINLAGASIFRRWNEAYKKLIIDSRILTTRNLVDAIPKDRAEKMALLSASAVGYYGPSGDTELNEKAPPGEDFAARLALDWESEAMKASEKGARVVVMRFGVALGKDGGALKQMALPFRLFAGGPLGHGNQWFSWIHIKDLCRAAHFCLEQSQLHSAVNFTAPHPVRNKELARTMGKVMNRPWFMPAPAFMVKLALGEFSSMILTGQRVYPRVLAESGFVFTFPNLREALEDLLG
jgi:hypothetical protein